jgi:thiol-disulfide isomerase/thioredoxin
MKLFSSSSSISFYDVAVLLLILIVSTSADDDDDVTLLTSSNYDELTANKTVFIKFYAPWCSYCKRIAKDWERLSKDWKDNDVGLVAAVDCTDHESGGKKLCNQLGIESFPTLKYGDPFQLEEYSGGRSYKDLSAFAKENLVPECSVDNLDICDTESKDVIQKYLTMDEKGLKSMIKEEEGKIEQAEKLFQETIDNLTKEYEVAESNRRQAIDEVMKGDLGLMRQVRSARERENSQTEERNDEL